MNRENLEHILRAACAITRQNRFLIIGSQSIIGVVNDPPGVLGASMEADIVALDAPELTDLIEGSLGELSMFHETFGYYAQAVGLDTAILPSGWEKRLKPIESPLSTAVGLALDPADLSVAKLAAGREKDGPFVAALFAHQFADPNVVRARIQEIPAARLVAYGLTVPILEKRLERVMPRAQNSSVHGPI
ncbi:MAG: DUF6036 family nucleotidyltransferase [Acidobacteriaceae bacterium]